MGLFVNKPNIKINPIDMLLTARNEKTMLTKKIK